MCDGSGARLFSLRIQALRQKLFVVERLRGVGEGYNTRELHIFECDAALRHQNTRRRRVLETRVYASSDGSTATCCEDNISTAPNNSRYGTETDSIGLT